MSDVLARILEDKRAEVARRETGRPLAELERAAAAAPPSRGFRAALARTVAEGRFGLIAEIKKASPSGGLIRPEFDPPALAAAYAMGGATCLSVLTDTPYFQGTDAHLQAARAAVSLPVLRKDFVVDPYQVVEARTIGADCVLLIAAALDDTMLAELAAVAAEWGLDALIEVHDEDELERALRIEPRLLGINNRNLKTLQTDLATTERLAARVPAGPLLVAESGLRSHADLVRLSRAGAACFLVGEHLMRQGDVEAATRSLLVG